MEELQTQGTSDPSLSDIPVGFQRDYLKYLSEMAGLVTVCSVCKKFLALKNLQPKYVTKEERQEKAHTAGRITAQVSGRVATEELCPLRGSTSAKGNKWLFSSPGCPGGREVIDFLWLWYC